MERKALVNIAAAVMTAATSGVILYQTLVVGSLLQEAGLIGIFLASMFSHLTVIGRDMFLPAFIDLINDYHPGILGVSAGLGAAIGDVTAYYWGLGIREAFEENERDDTVMNWIEKYGLIAVLFVASSPLPDVPIILLAGSARLPFRKFLAIEAIGKSLFYSLAAAVGGAVFLQLRGLMPELALSAVVVAASIMLCVLTSWKKSREKILQLLKSLLR